MPCRRASILHRHLLVVAFGGAVLFFFLLADIIVHAIPTFVLDRRISVAYLCGKKEEPDE